MYDAIKEVPMATEMLKTQKFIIKLLGIIIITVLVLWFTTIGIFVWYLNQYDFTTTTDANLTQDISDNDNTNISQSGNID